MKVKEINMNIYSAFATVTIIQVNYMSSANFKIQISKTFDLLTLPSVLRMLERFKKVILLKQYSSRELNSISVYVCK